MTHHVPALTPCSCLLQFPLLWMLCKATRSMRMIRSPSWPQYPRAQNLTAPCMAAAVDRSASWRKPRPLSPEAFRSTDLEPPPTSSREWIGTIRTRWGSPKGSANPLGFSGARRILIRCAKDFLIFHEGFVLSRSFLINDEFYFCCVLGCFQ